MARPQGLQALLAELRRQYRELSGKYREQAGRLRDRKVEQSAVYRLGWSGMRLSASGMALVRADQVLLANARWHELDRVLGRGGLRRAGTAGPREYAGLRDLAVAEAARLTTSPLTRTVE